MGKEFTALRARSLVIGHKLARSRTPQLLAVLLTGLASVQMTGLKPIFLSAYVTYLQISPRLAGFAIAAEMGGALLATSFLAGTVHRLNRRRLALAGLGLLVCGNIASLASPTVPLLLAIRFIVGSGEGIGAGVMAAAVSAMVSPERVFGGYTVIQLLVASAGFHYTPVLLSRFGIHGLFLLFALGAAPALIMNRWFPAGDRSSPSELVVARPAVRTWGVVLIVAAGLAFYMAVGGFWPYVAEIGRSHGIAARAITGMLAKAQVWGTGGAIFSLVAGRRFGRLLPIILSCCASIGALSMLLHVRTTPAAYGLAMQLYMGAWLVFFPYLMGIVADIDRQGRLTNVIYAMTSIGFTAGPATAALIYDGVSFGGVIWYSLSLHAFCAVLMVLGLWRSKTPQAENSAQYAVSGGI